MELFACGYGDKRRDAAVSRLYGAMVEPSSVVVRRLGGRRCGEISAHRMLSSARVTPAATVECLARRTSQAAAGLRVVVAQGTTEVSYPGRAFRGGPGGGARGSPGGGLGPAGRAGASPGFFIHAAVAVDADAVLGLVDAQLWTRKAKAAPEDAAARKAETARHKRLLAEKESRRWLAGARAAADRLAGAAVRIIQLVDARDGSSRPASDAAAPEQVQAAEVLGPTLKGRIARQQNRHPRPYLLG